MQKTKGKIEKEENKIKGMYTFNSKARRISMKEGKKKTCYTIDVIGAGNVKTL